MKVYISSVDLNGMTETKEEERTLHTYGPCLVLSMKLQREMNEFPGTWKTLTSKKMFPAQKVV